jgi:hypothetical protein
MQTQNNLAAYSGNDTDTLKTSILAALRKFIEQRPGLDPRTYFDPSDPRGWQGRAAYRAESRSITRDLNHAKTLLRKVETASGISGQALLDAAKLNFSGRLKIETVRDWECNCGAKYSAPVKTGTTANLSGEVTAWCPRCKARPVMGSAHRIRIDYTTGQYYPTEYRRAVAAVCAGALWDYIRETSMPSPVYFVEWQNERGEYVRANREPLKQRDAAEWLATLTRNQKEKEKAAFETVPHGYGYTTIREAYKTPHGYISGGDWLRAYFVREFGRGIASRFFH